MLFFFLITSEGMLPLSRARSHFRIKNNSGVHCHHYRWHYCPPSTAQPHPHHTHTLWKNAHPLALLNRRWKETCASHKHATCHTTPHNNRRERAVKCGKVRARHSNWNATLFWCFHANSLFGACAELRMWKCAWKKMVWDMIWQKTNVLQLKNKSHSKPRAIIWKFIFNRPTFSETLKTPVTTYLDSKWKTLAPHINPKS